MDEFQPQAAPDTEAIGFPVDLSREEYIAFNMLLAKNGGIRGVGVGIRKGTEYLKALPDGSEGNNLGNLPSITN